jgi:hypothetical protein
VGINEVVVTSIPCPVEIYDLAQQLTEQRKEDEDEEDHGTEEMQTKELTDILSAIDMTAESYVISTLTGNAALQ